MLKKALLLFAILICHVAFAIPFSIVPVGTLPTEVYQGGTVNASYTVTNLTGEAISSAYVKYLPPNVVVRNVGCGPAFNLTAYGSCTLNLQISGAVDADDPSPHDHLFVCFPEGKLCAGTAYPLNVQTTTVNSLQSINIVPSVSHIPQGETEQLEAFGTYASGEVINLTTNPDLTWSSNNTPVITVGAHTGVATAVASSGSATITATMSGISATATAIIKDLVSIAVSPTPANLSIGNQRQYTAIGTYNDSSTLDITNRVNWTSSSPIRATIGASTGLATGVSLGSTNITASKYGVTSNTASLTVIDYLFATSDQCYQETCPGGAALEHVYRCDISSDLITISGCTDMDISGVSFDHIRGISFNPLGTYVYLADIIGNQIVYCEYTTSSTFSNCQSIPGSNDTTTSFSTPVSVAFSPDGTVAYVTNFYANNLSKCSADPTTGVISDCARLSYPVVSAPDGMVVNKAGTYAFLSNFATGQAMSCSINANDDLQSCQAQDGILFASQVALNPNETILYVGNERGALTVNYYSFNAGVFTSNGTTGSGATANADAVAIYPSNTISYIGSFDITGTMFYCTINGSTGAYSSCSSAGAVIPSTFALALH